MSLVIESREEEKTEPNPIITRVLDKLANDKLAKKSASANLACAGGEPAGLNWLVKQMEEAVQAAEALQRSAEERAAEARREAMIAR